MVGRVLELEEHLALDFDRFNLPGHPVIIAERPRLMMEADTEWWRNA
jgi:hypothetical protein